MWSEQRNVRDLKMEGASRETHEPGGSGRSKNVSHGRCAGRPNVGTTWNRKEGDEMTIRVGSGEEARAIEDNHDQLRLRKHVA
jgi:hypothetical protein